MTALKRRATHRAEPKRTAPAIGLLLGLAAIALLMAACAAGPNTQESVPDAQGGVAGFWLGLWHGVIAPVTFVVSLFADGVNVYDVHNNGNWYNLGFVFGVIASLGGGGGAAGSKRRKS